MVLTLKRLKKSTFGPNTYEKHPLIDAAVTIERGLFDGSSMKISTSRKVSANRATSNALLTTLQKVWPVRYYSDSTKIFDGCIKAPGYTSRANNFQQMEVIAYGWEKELGGIDLSTIYPDGLEYVNKSFDFIFADLCRIANDYGMTKQAIYAYDTSKMPAGDYDANIFAPANVTLTGTNCTFTTGSTALTGTGTSFLTELAIGDKVRYTTDADSEAAIVKSITDDTNAVLKYGYVGSGGTGAGIIQKGISKIFTGTILTAFQELSKELDIRETATTWEWAIKIDAIQSDSYIYIIPQMVSLDQSVSLTIPDWKLMPPKDIWKDFSRLVNSVQVWGGNNLKTEVFSSTLILDSYTIPDTDEWFDATSKPDWGGWYYLQITMNNNTASTKAAGVLTIQALDALGDPYSEDIVYNSIPANTIRTVFTNKRYKQLAINTFHAVQLSSCVMTVKRVLNGIAGKSLNDFGYKGETIINASIDTQERINSYSNQLIRLYHAPVIKADLKLKPNFGTLTDLVGKRIDFVNTFTNATEEFIVTKQKFKFEGQQEDYGLEAIAYNTDMDYED